ncbi:hypothetical protein BFW38_16250 [Terasakiispira papahanaumokuakeensis]|uniref:Glycosyltransferase 2-like domain-containing protein n=1 Tax=Terasakiispira papahanaumokuakeensis TaxID=197479 RepID=A0A1E2VDB4_9GAMM|nr:glycosyltransferase [Terasakiispira papahanaumokuakeensis]ODC04852.1 hypothetical protein BFW38_16250 [Terasakiispira papahanaumokuakeensis]
MNEVTPSSGPSASRPRVSIICPAYNEAAGILNFLHQLDVTLAPWEAQYRFKVAVVDDGSGDDTAEQAAGYNPAAFELVVCRLTRNFGKEGAMQAGLERYAGEASIVVDTDLQHPLHLIPEMLRHWQAGAKVVESVKTDRGREARWYQWASDCFYRGLRRLSGLELADHSDFKLLDAEVVATLCALPEKTRFFRGLVQWTGYASVQLPFEVQDRAEGESSWGFWTLLRYSIHNLTSFSSAPLYLITLIGALMLAVSAVLGSVSLYQWSQGIAVTGFTTVILLLLFIGSMLMVSLGIIGLYISRIYDELKQRPVYLVASETVKAPSPLAG